VDGAPDCSRNKEIVQPNYSMMAGVGGGGWAAEVKHGQVAAGDSTGTAPPSSGTRRADEDGYGERILRT
jgi:hypothetical protein